MRKYLSLLLFVFLVTGPGIVRPADQAGEWVSLFDGQSLNGWKASENPGSLKVEDGMIVCDGPRSHLFYTGSVASADFKNFELKAEVMATPGANSGIYFHTRYQEEGWPEQGYEVQVNNTHKGAGNYVERKKTGSLYAVRNVYKQLVPDNEWFSMHIIVMANHVMVKVNDHVVVDYVQPDQPMRLEQYKGRVLSHGTFAIQCHDPDSKVYFRDIQVKTLPDDLPADPSRMPVIDETAAQVYRLNATNFPVIDFHVHVKGGLSLQEALTKSHRVGIQYGVAPNCGVGFPITTDQGIYDFVAGMKGQPVFLGMQAEGREWVTMFSKEAISRFDYVFSDALTFTDDQGRRTQLWKPETVHIKNEQDFMEMYVDRILSVLNNEPIDIFVNPTFLPEEIRKDYDRLWTGDRMDRVINAAVKNGVAIEINDRYTIPSARFIKRAKQAGVTFSLGTNNADANYGNLDYSIRMIQECGLTAADMFMPKPDGRKPIQVKSLTGSRN